MPWARTWRSCSTLRRARRHSSPLARAEAELHRLDRLLTRFEPGSELSRLNRRRRTAVGPELLELVELALAARTRTRGRFDPTVHDALVGAGYDRTFARVTSAAVPPRSAPCGGGVRVERAASTVELDPGARLDLGGIAKGYAADRAAAILAEAGPALVDAGGDITAHGRPWPVAVETADTLLTVELRGAAIATSGRDRRRWMRAGAEQHHLIDPATGRPAEGDLLRVTAVAATAAEAEVVTTSLFLAGAARAAAEAEADGVAAVLVTRDGRTVFTGGLA